MSLHAYIHISKKPAPKRLIKDLCITSQDKPDSVDIHEPNHNVAPQQPLKTPVSPTHLQACMHITLSLPGLQIDDAS